MKVRIAGNTIRFRLRKQDVASLEKHGLVLDLLEFGAGQEDRLEFKLETAEALEPQIRYSAGATTILLPRSVVEEFSQTDRVGFNFNIDTGRDRSVYVLVEKDFSCLDGSDADNEETYVNPNEQTC
jgi:hypothetical protein